MLFAPRWKKDHDKLGDNIYNSNTIEAEIFQTFFEIHFSDDLLVFGVFVINISLRTVIALKTCAG